MYICKYTKKWLCIFEFSNLSDALYHSYSKEFVFVVVDVFFLFFLMMSFRLLVSVDTLTGFLQIFSDCVPLSKNKNRSQSFRLRVLLIVSCFGCLLDVLFVSVEPSGGKFDAFEGRAARHDHLGAQTISKGASAPANRESYGKKSPAGNRFVSPLRLSVGVSSRPDRVRLTTPKHWRWFPQKRDTAR